jgi:hypothetical protein
VAVDSSLFAVADNSLFVVEDNSGRGDDRDVPSHDVPNHDDHGLPIHGRHHQHKIETSTGLQRQLIGLKKVTFS